MEKASRCIILYIFSLAELVGFSLANSVLKWVTTNFSLIVFSFLQPHHVDFSSCSSMIHDEQCVKNSPGEARADPGLSREDVEMVMGRIGIGRSPEGEQFDEYMGFDELNDMFAETEPSLEELKEAFCVFDEGSDGFIDAIELQRVLSKLGFGEGHELEACKEMIARYDVNQDGRIDFNEFVKLTERSFS